VLPVAARRWVLTDNRKIVDFVFHYMFLCFVFFFSMVKPDHQDTERFIVALETNSIHFLILTNVVAPFVSFSTKVFSVALFTIIWDEDVKL
jgi:hypothetical protein